MKEFLHRHGIDFNAIDVGELADASEKIRRETGGMVGTPAVIIGAEARIGYDPQWMRRRLGIGELGDGGED